MKDINLKKIANEINTIKRALNTTINIFETKMQLPVLNSLPQIIDVVLTRSCNLKCIFCKNYETSGAKQISMDCFEKVARHFFPTTRTLSICSGGEPYLHKNLIDLLRIARKYKISTFVLSNGMLVREDIIRTIIQEELISRHGFSVDGITASTVEALRVNAKLDLILENIATLIRIRKEERKKTPSIVIRYALMRSNIEELPEAIQHWGKMGIDTIQCNYLSVCNDINPQESLFFHQDLMTKIFKKSRALAVDYPHLKLILPPTVCQDTPFQHQPRQCNAPWNFIRIEPDGQLFPCYKSWGTICMGNIINENDNSIKDIWNNSAYQALRRTTNNDNVQKYYSYCSKCPFRFGLGNLSAHLEDDNWFDNINLDDTKKAMIFYHRNR
jgi:radical SAM protein with 4Fe4S-binding SPASM domain